MNDLERRIINELQGGFPISERPFLTAANALGITENALIETLRGLLDRGVLSRFGPLYHAEHLGGVLSLVAMKVPQNRFDEVASVVNSYDEVAHNYERDHVMNMWFVIATDRPERKTWVLREISHRTDLEVFDMPKIAEYFVGLRLEV